MPETFHEKLRRSLDEYAHEVYRVSKKFPRDEMYGITSQLRRSALSAILNYIEGYARSRNKVNKLFLETAYGSLKESEYLIQFAAEEGYMSEKDLKSLAKQADSIGAMLWRTMTKMV